MKRTIKWLLRKRRARALPFTVRACKHKKHLYNTAWPILASLGLMASLAIDAQSATFVTPSRSTTIALTTNNRFLVVANRQADSVSVIEVRNTSGGDVRRRLAEIRVGE